MLTVVTGRFHPSLESAFVERIQQLKQNDPWAGLAVVVPSKPILDRLRRVLAVDSRLSLLNLHLLTFHQFALRLADEQQRRHGQNTGRVVDDLCFEYLLRHLVRERTDESPPLRQLGHSVGTWAGLWSTIRDLKDGAVDPATALEALQEGCFGDEDREWLTALFSLQAAVQEISDQLNVGTADDLAQALLPKLSASQFLASLRHICYYGFYDLTQVQLSLFQGVAAHFPTTLFFPLTNEPSFAFSRRFFDRHIQPLVGLDVPLHVAASSPAPPPELSIVSVIGPEEELSVTCRTILDLVETRGYRFDEIGVVARTLEPYRTLLSHSFDRHRIPLATSGRRPLIHHPLCKTLLLLATLPANDFYRVAVLDIVTSPFYRPSNECEAEWARAYRPEQWRAVAEALNITHGVEEWKRLGQSCTAAVELGNGADEVGAIGPFEVAPEVLRLFGKTVSRLLASYAEVPERGSFRTLFGAFRRLADEHLRRPDESHEELNAMQPLWDAVTDTLDSLDALALIEDELTWTAFAELLTRAFERATDPLDTASSEGVAVLDAMAARGLFFKALFVLGVNEKIFPRYIREDPFLRDRHRRVLETTLGYKVGEKLPGYEEEALLFTLLTQAAERRLSLSFQRADGTGRMLAPSPYITEAAHRPGWPVEPIEVIPRRLTERLAQRPTLSGFLSPAEIAQWMAIVGRNPAEFLDALGAEATMLRHGMEAVARTEEEQPVLTAFDGLTGSLDSHWTRLTDRGIAPTPLERYARCPFRYFAADVLRLTPVRVPMADGPDARVLGTFCHAALRRCYEMLLPTGWPAKPVTDDTVDFCIDTAVEEASDLVDRQHRTGHYLLWELAKGRIVDVITAAVDEETCGYQREGFVPVGFEVTAEGVLPVPGEAPEVLKIRGRIDRLDRHSVSGALRVVDYKLKLGKTIAAQDRQLVESAIRGYRLQPPLYTLLQLPDLGTPAEVHLLFLAPDRPAPISRSTFPAAAWLTENGRLVQGTVGRLINGIRNGRFFIVSESSCDTCEFRVACRREHQPTWWRVSRARESKDLNSLRRQRVTP